MRKFWDVSKLPLHEGESTNFKWHTDHFLVIFRCDTLFAEDDWQEAEGRANVMFSDLVDTNCWPCGVAGVPTKKAQPLRQNEPWPTKLMFGVEHQTQTLRIHRVFSTLRRKKAKSDTEEGVPANETYEACRELRGIEPDKVMLCWETAVAGIRTHTHKCYFRVLDHPIFCAILLGCG